MVTHTNQHHQFMTTRSTSPFRASFLDSSLGNNDTFNTSVSKNRSCNLIFFKVEALDVTWFVSWKLFAEDEQLSHRPKVVQEPLSFICRNQTKFVMTSQHLFLCHFQRRADRWRDQTCSCNSSLTAQEVEGCTCVGRVLHLHSNAFLLE